MTTQQVLRITRAGVGPEHHAAAAFIPEPTDLTSRGVRLAGRAPPNIRPRLCHLAISLLSLAWFSASLHAESIEVDSVLIQLIDQVDVPAQALGALLELHAEVGTTVEQGQLLAKIDDTEAQLQQQRAHAEVEIAQHQAANDVAIRSAQKSLNFAREDLERLRRADQDQPRSVSQSELERAKLEAEQAVLDLERARSELDLARIKEQLTASDFALAKRNVEIRRITAPSSGVVVSVLHRPGEWVKPGDQMFRIVRTDRLRADGFVAASEVLEDLRGAVVSVKPDLATNTDTQFSGKIVFVSPEIDPVNGQVRVLADVENPAGILRPGLRAKMTILSGNSR